ncbi:hypothetical protein DRN73_05195 [Candidatus Pacearchaeota archaeon]|nr:MAG: hypothetical protein DRN73_05195 [Candidatus Pacearchaeota archaeon]
MNKKIIELVIVCVFSLFLFGMGKRKNIEKEVGLHVEVFVNLMPMMLQPGQSKESLIKQRINLIVETTNEKAKITKVELFNQKDSTFIISFKMKEKETTKFVREKCLNYNSKINLKEIEEVFAKIYFIYENKEHTKIIDKIKVQKVY